MKVLLVDPGSTYSTTEVHSGLRDGLVALGASVVEYHYLGHLRHASRWMKVGFDEAGIRIDPLLLDQGSMYEASTGALVWALRDEVDVVLIVSGIIFSSRVVEMMRRAGIQVGFIFTESPYDDERQAAKAALASISWTNERASADLIGARYLPMAYNPQMHFPCPPTNGSPRHDVVFVGVGYPERLALLEGVDWSGIDLGLYGDWKYVADDSPLRPFVHQGIIPNAKAIELYRGAKVGLNLYRTCVDYWSNSGVTVAPGESLNPRAYELAACGVVQVTEQRAEAREVFGENVPCFTNSAGLEEEVRALLSDDQLRLAQRKRQVEAVAPHTYHERASRIVRDLRDIGVPHA